MPIQKTLLAATVLAFASLCAAQSPTNSPPTHRFEGGAQLSGPAGVSADSRFELDAAAFPSSTDFSDSKPTSAALATPSVPKALEQLGGRFGLTASLTDPRALAIACTSFVEDIFKNGFE
jgi:hypothetical protein